MKIRHRFNSPTRGSERVQGRIWFNRKGKTYLGWGRVVLLERIRKYGSLSAAARSMKMSYRQAWGLVDQMNDLAPTPLVIKRVGGKSGGGADVTKEGDRAIREFWNTVDRFQRWMDLETRRSGLCADGKKRKESV
jgi:molybdate transport system regulatory protein